MRIIGGTAKGRRLKAPRGTATRPTADRVREAIFNILGPPDGDVLDLFAGAGTLGLEALSRGASHITFVDSATASIRCVGENLRALAREANAEVVRGDALRTVARLAASGRSFHWVFADPPYAWGRHESLLVAIGRGKLLTPGGQLVIEHDRREPLPEKTQELLRTDVRQYGDTAVSFYATVAA